MKAKLAALVLAGSLLGGASTASAGLFGLFGSSPIDVVQEGVLPDYSKTKKVGPALESYYDCQKGSAEWDTFETEKGETMGSCYKLNLHQNGAPSNIRTGPSIVR